MGDATGCSTDESGRGLPNLMLDDESLQQLLQTSGSPPFSGIEQGPPQVSPALQLAVLSVRRLWPHLTVLP